MPPLMGVDIMYSQEFKNNIDWNNAIDLIEYQDGSFDVLWENEKTGEVCFVEATANQIARYKQHLVDMKHQQQYGYVATISLDGLVEGAAS